MKMVVIGSTGSVGMYLTDYLNNELTQLGYEIIAASSRETDFFEKLDIEYVSINMNNKDDFKKLPTKNVFAVVLLAGVMPGNMEGYSPEKYLQTNILGTFNVLEYCRINQINRIIYTQTIRDIGNYLNEDGPIKSDLPRSFSYTGDHAVYVISKNTAVDLIEHYYQEYGLKRFILRLPTIYLYSRNMHYYVDGKKKMQGYRYLIERAMKGEPLEMWGDPSKAHDFVYVKDLCQMVKKALLVENVDGGIYNVGTNNPITLEEQLKGIIRVFSPEDNLADIIPCPEKTSARSYTFDIEKAKKELGYSPEFDFIDFLIDFKEEMQLDRFSSLETKIH